MGLKHDLIPSTPSRWRSPGHQTRADEDSQPPAERRGAPASLGPRPSAPRLLAGLLLGPAQRPGRFVQTHAHQPAIAAATTAATASSSTPRLGKSRRPRAWTVVAPAAATAIRLLAPIRKGSNGSTGILWTQMAAPRTGDPCVTSCSCPIKMDPGPKGPCHGGPHGQGHGPGHDGKGHPPGHHEASSAHGPGPHCPPPGKGAGPHGPAKGHGPGHSGPPPGPHH
ncbi:translation initiation factor IF-2-like [Lemur catta]|uniref:translation initiation factor IF-2-like n=1 Tax=Lemur catta TaxID=9447 RepID=UPI001E26AD34|nr:translation initiation factor IF-2-like [Lemur catta]